MDPHNIGMFELGQGAGFGQKSLQTRLIRFQFLIAYGVNRLVPSPYAELKGKIFLDSNLPIQISIGSKIGYPKTASAENMFDSVPQ